MEQAELVDVAGVKTGGTPAASAGETDDPSARDAEALARVAAGDAGAFAGVVDRHKDRLFRHVRRRLGGDPHRAEDVTQDVFLRLFRAARGGAYTAGRASVRTWLYTIAGNCVTDELRRRQREKRPPPHQPSRNGRTAADPHATAAGAESDASVAAMLDQLPPEQRQVVELKLLDDLTFAEIAELTGCPVPTVKSRLVYALRKLKQIMELEGRVQR